MRHEALHLAKKNRIIFEFSRQIKIKAHGLCGCLMVSLGDRPKMSNQSFDKMPLFVSCRLFLLTVSLVSESLCSRNMCNPYFPTFVVKYDLEFSIKLYLLEQPLGLFQSRLCEIRYCPI